MARGGYRGAAAVQLVGLPALTGTVVGLGAAALFWLVNDVMLPAILRAPLAVAIKVLDRRRRGRLTPATVDQYLLAFHEPDRALEMRELPPRMVATVATVGLGGAMGLEAPSVFMGSVVGNTVQRRLSRLMEGGDRRTLVVAGAAAGGAILRVPLTAALFAIESPFQGAIAGRLLVPALVGGVSGYLAFAAVYGDALLLPLLAEKFASRPAAT
ncbi:MAG: chloride channel protein [Egibacteraceae bacterium]